MSPETPDSPDRLERMWERRSWRGEGEPGQTPRPDHDITQQDLDEEARLESALTAAIVVAAVLGAWKMLDLAFGDVGPALRFAWRILRSIA